MSIIVAVLVLGLIITIHELGHFIVAKIFKVPVREFSIGMGPRIYSRIVKNTRVSIKALPIGGSCALIGEDDAGSGDFTHVEGVKIDEEGLYDFEGVKFTKEEIEKNNYSAIAPYKKFFICLAGPFMNFLLAFSLSFVLVTCIGYDVPIISNVAQNSAAKEAKPNELMKGDEIIELSIPGESEEIINYRDLALFMQLNNDDIVRNNYPLVISFKRDKKILKTVVYPKLDENENRAIIGISFEDLYKKPHGIIETTSFAMKEFYFYIKTTVMSLRMLIRGKLNANDVSGPVGTVAVMGSVISEAKKFSFMSAILTVITMTVLISANLGVMNLLPIPALDGGRIVFAAIEMIMGKPINKDVEAFANAVTMVLLLMFMMWIFGMDIYKLMTGTLIK